MLSRVIAAAVLTISALSVLSAPEARSDQLGATVASCLSNTNCAHARPASRLYTWRLLCDSSPDCSHGKADEGGGILFEVRQDGPAVQIYCSNSGACAVVAPKGGRTALLYPARLLSSN
jgi:hypothetical protein